MRISVKSEPVVISPYLNAFKMYEQTEVVGKETFSYQNPLNYDFNVTIDFGNNLKGKTYSKSKLKVTVHSDKFDYYELESTETYLLNTICKFDYGTVPIYLYKTVCCRTTIQDYNFTTNDFYSQNFCKYAQSRYSSACFIQLLFSKSFITKSNKANHYYFGLKAFIFATNSETCNQNSKVTEILSVSKLYPLSFSIGLGVVWDTVFRSPKNLSLEVGRPLHSLEPDTVVSIPLRINVNHPFEYLKIECHLGGTLDIKSIIFDNSIFDADYDNSMRTNSIASIDLNFRGATAEKTQHWWVEKGLLLFIIRVHVNDGSSFSSDTSNKNGWIKCFLKQMRRNKRVTDDYNQSSQTKAVPLFINSGKFIIIPIFETNSYFSILSDFQLPIQLQNDFLKVYSIHNVRDGSFIDVTNKVSCQPVNSRSIKCPNSMMKSSDNYFGFEDFFMDSTNDKQMTSKWDIILQMQTWTSVIFSPIDLWIAESWRLELSDRSLTEITGWRFPIRSTTTQRIICPPLFQTSQIKVLARLAKRNQIGEKEYYGMNEVNKAPLLDVTSHLQPDSIRISSKSNAQLLFNIKLSQFYVSTQSDYGSLDVHLMSSNSKRLLAIDRISIVQDLTNILKLKVYCIESMDLYENSWDILSNYRQLYVEYSYENNTNNLCYLEIFVIYSDYSEIRLKYLSTKHYRLFQSLYDFSTESYVVRQISLAKPIKFTPTINISLYESLICHSPKIVYSGHTIVNYVDHTQNIPLVRSTPPKITKTSLQPMTVSNFVTPSLDLLKDLSSLYYGLYALIILVAIVAVIVLINCLVKLNYRKISRQIANANNQAVSDKLLKNTQSPPSIDVSSTNYSKHPPLLPPPGPLKNSSESANELASSAFWSLSSQESPNRCSYSYHEKPIPLSTLSSPTIRSSPLVGSVYSNHRYTLNPSPSSDQADGGYLSSENNSKYFDTVFKQTIPEARQMSPEELELNENISELASSSGTFPVPPPCAPLKWSIQWATSMGSVIPVFSQSYLSSKPQESGNSIARTVPTSGSISSMHHWLTKRVNQMPQSLPYTKSIDNLCEKSSGLGSLTSTQQEDSSLLSDEDNYHVSINSDKEGYRKYVKKCG